MSTRFSITQIEQYNLEIPKEASLFPKRFDFSEVTRMWH